MSRQQLNSFVTIIFDSDVIAMNMFTMCRARVPRLKLSCDTNLYTVSYRCCHGNSKLIYFQIYTIST